LMSALQAGTARGRQDAEAVQPSPAPDDSDSADATGEKPLSPVAWFTDAPPGDGPAPGTTWADAATATFPLTAGTDLADVFRPTDEGDGAEPDHGAGGNGAEPGDGAGVDGAEGDGAGSDGVTPGGESLADEPETVVHYGEIVPRQSAGPDDDPPPDRPAYLPTARPDGQPTHSDKDA
jgi:hypothetical protein